MRALHFQRVVGAGAFGAVYLCDLVADKGFRRQVAVKVLQRDHPNSQMFMARVRDEARLLGLLQDDHILKVLEIVQVDGRDAVVMEYVEGLDLAALIEGGQRPPARALAELGAAIAGALHRAHTAVHPATGVPLNVIHRDVKPANVMITVRGGVKLLDFGVARARFEARESFTGQFVLGTLNYMAPEYIVTGDVSPAADVYGLGLVLWEAVTGEVFGQPRLKLDQHNPRRDTQLARITGEYAPLVDVLRQMLEWEPLNRPDTLAVENALTALSDGMRGSGLRAWCGTAVPQLLALRKQVPDDNALVGRQIQLAETAGDEPPDRQATRSVDAPAKPIARPIAPALTPSAVPDPPSALSRPAVPDPSADEGRPTAAYSRGSLPPTSGISEAVRSAPPPSRPAADPKPARSPAATFDTSPSVGAPSLAPPSPPASTGRTAVPDAEISRPTPAPRLAPPRPADPEPRQRPRPRGPSTAVLIVQGLVVGGGIGVLLVLLLLIVVLLRRYL